MLERLREGASVAVKIRERPSVPSECHRAAASATASPDSGRQMLKMRLMGENERERRGNFAPLIDASVKSEKSPLPFPFSPSFFFSARSSQSGHSIKHLHHLFRSRLRPPFFGDSFFLHFEMQMFVLLPASCSLLVFLLLSIVFGRHTACFRVCLLLA